MTPSPLRKLAIRLACIHAEDRDWILAQLGSDEARRVNELLQEIETLGLASDPSVVKAVMAEVSSQGVTRPLPDSEQQARLAILARAEHPLWAALALQLQDKDTRRKLIEALPDSAAVRRWDKVFATEPVPAALARCISLHLQPEERAHD